MDLSSKTCVARALALAAVAAAALAVFRIARGPRLRDQARAARAARFDAAADLEPLRPGAAPVPCQDWDAGTGLRGYVWHAPEPRAILLLQHGFGEYAQRYVNSYGRLIPHLLSAGFSVYAVDLPGHGHSPGQRALVDAERAVEDHLTARRVLRSEPYPLFLFGHSLGGLVTAASVAREQEGVAAVVLSSPFLGAHVPALASWIMSGAARIAPALPTIRLSPSHLSRLPHEREAARADPRIYHGRIPLLAAASMATSARKNWALYPGWTVPTLVIHGTADRLTNPAFSRRFFEAIRSDDKAIHLVPGGRHELLNDADRQIVLGMVMSWLALHHRPAAPRWLGGAAVGEGRSA